MENKHKQFKPYDKVLVRDLNGCWQSDFYSYWDSDRQHVTMVYGESLEISDNHILPYEGNAHLVGTTDEPDEDIYINEGEWVMETNGSPFLPSDFRVAKFVRIYTPTNTFEVKQEYGNSPTISRWSTYCVRFSDFDPNDMEETRKHVLTMKNGKIVRYKR